MNYSYDLPDEFKRLYREEDGMNIPFAWACEKFGIPKTYTRAGGRRWGHNGDKFFFRDEVDLIVFLLRWS